MRSLLPGGERSRLRRGRRAGSLLGLVLLIALAAGLAGCNEPPRFEGPVRHVVLISLDTTRADHFGFYGNETVATPRLDALAEESIVLDDYMTVAPRTLASHVSLMTGKYPHSHATPRNGFLVHPDNVLLAEVLRGHGFTTAGFLGSFALESRFNINQGFDHYDERFDQLVGDGGADQNQRSASAVTDAVIDYLDGEGVPGNLFLFAHYFDPHAPYAPPPPYDTMYDSSGRRGLPGLDAVTRLCASGRPSALVDRFKKQYAGEISYMDHHVGRLLDALDARGILDDALVVVTSDHGENFCEHEGFFDHGLTTYQTTMRAVGMIRLPKGRHRGRRVGSLVASIDLMPTILSWLGLSIPDGVEGEALDLDAIENRPDPGPRYGEASKPWESVETDPRWLNARKARCVRENGLKLIQVPYADTEELYDLVADPLEQHDLLLADRPELRQRADKMRQRLAEWSASTSPWPALFESSQQDETIERLRSLGYLGGADD